MKHMVLTVCLLLAVLNVPSQGAGPKEAALSVRIVPMYFYEKGDRAIALRDPSQHFYVVVSNISQEPVRLWQEWCSWGYCTLSFTVIDADGKTIVVKKAERAYMRNFPDWTLVPPGDHMVFEVSFEKNIWQNAPLPEKGSFRNVKMQAVFEIPEDEDSKKRGVWTGKTSSPELTYTIYR